MVGLNFNFFKLILQDEKQFKRWGLWDAYITLRESKKHMSKNGLGYLDETPSLKHKKVA